MAKIRLSQIEISAFKILSYAGPSDFGTTKIKCNHNGTEIEAIFYITNVPDTKIILRLQLCIDFGLIVIQCDDECKCKNVQVAEASSTPTENVQGPDDKNSMLPSVPLNTKIEETNLKIHVMQLYPDLLDGVRTIKNAVAHLDRGDPCSIFTKESA